MISCTAHWQRLDLFAQVHIAYLTLTSHELWGTGQIATRIQPRSAGDAECGLQIIYPPLEQPWRIRGEFVVSKTGPGYDARDRDPNRKFRGNCQTLVFTRRSSEGKRWRKRYVPPGLVYSHWANLGGYREIPDARAHDDLLDDRAGHRRIDDRRWYYPHVFASDKRTISSRRPHFFHAGRDPGPIHLL